MVKFSFEQNLLSKCIESKVNLVPEFISVPYPSSRHYDKTLNQWRSCCLNILESSKQNERLLIMGTRPVWKGHHSYQITKHSDLNTIRGVARRCVASVASHVRAQPPAEWAAMEAATVQARAYANSKASAWEQSHGMGEKEGGGGRRAYINIGCPRIIQTHTPQCAGTHARTHPIYLFHRGGITHHFTPSLSVSLVRVPKSMAYDLLWDR